MPDNTAEIDPPTTELYGADYYASHCGPLAYRRDEPEWGRFFGNVADEILRSLRPRRVFDAGCAHGFLLEALWDRGVETWGRDISGFALSQVRADLASFVTQGSIADSIPGEYDLVTCIEVLEHMEEAEAIRAIAAMATAAPRLLFSSSPSDFDEPTHVNVRPVIWWLHQFADAGFSPVADYDASFITPHAFLLERSDEGRGDRALNAFAALIRQRMLATEHRLRLAQVEQQLADTLATATAAAAVEQAKVGADRDRALAQYQTERAQHAVARFRHGEVVAQFQAELAEAQAGRRAAEAAHEILLGSTVWKATRPLRRAGGLLPPSWRRAMRKLLHAAYWIVTRQFRHRVAEWRARRAVALLPPPAPAPVETPYERWVREVDTLTAEDRAAIRAHIAQLADPPLISVVMPVYETPERLLREAIASVRAQLYPHWELCIADDASPSEGITRILREAGEADPRIKWMRRDSNGHIAAATNSALSLAAGNFVALMDHDDLLPEQALYEVAAALDAHPDTDMIYTDEDHIDGSGRRSSPYFKPDWNIDLLLGHNLVSHLGVYRRTLIERLGGLRGGPLDGSQDYDLALRVAAVTEAARIRHIPAVLYHWRRLGDEASAFSQAHLDRCVAAAQRAIRDYLAGQGLDEVAVTSAPAAPTWTRLRWPLPEPPPRVSLIVPTRDRPELLARCAAGLLHRTDYPDIELLIVDNESTDPEAIALLGRLQAADRRVRVLPFDGAFNYSALNNAAVRAASGEVIVLVNNDIDVIDSGWLREMVSHAMRPDVGAVGAKLLFADGSIQHAGTVLGVGAHLGGAGVAGHYGYGNPRDAVGYFGQLALTREVSAVTGACLALRREVFEAVGGLDEKNLPVSFNDVDLCLRIREHGLRVIWTPFAELFHLESSSRGLDVVPGQIDRAMGEAFHMRDRWGAVLDSDPFYNPNFDRMDHSFQLGAASRRAVPWAGYRQPV